jgi:hypothetical protein
MSAQPTMGKCPKCSRHGFIMPLHGAHGGPMLCLQCGMEWHAKHTRRRKFGRVVVKAMNLYLENGGRFTDLDKFKESLALARLGFKDPIVSAFAADEIGTDVGDITSELLADVLQLTHPDKHPPERQELAKRVTQELLALKPFVFPAPKPKPAPAYTPPRDDSFKSRREPPKEPSQPAYPCKVCADTVLYYYCAPCKAEYEKRQEAKREAQRAKQREQYRRRQERKRWRRPKKPCEVCGSPVEAKRRDAKHCSPACRQRAHRQRVTDNLRVSAENLNTRDSVDAAP